MRKKLILIIFLSILIVGFVVLHSTPHLALRTHVFFTGHPIKAFTTEIVDDESRNEIDKEKFDRLNAKAYSLTKPPIEKATDGELKNYLVRKRGWLYFARYYGHG
ncbi:hypothetical protein CEY16_13190 [Halalkalibacillus sediminis]|uniref:Uncharacterized protein n=1 Tax=Halalkalibacillus sediminis TaxID=2018042 RepID=A0A2I0QR19_9BACI|nr:hypothetical protein [Halalkalibacillus sediminis]PKR76769.1 hypothetical protein CEY16_13190 [Halalkalibacillus sediminis]